MYNMCKCCQSCFETIYWHCIEKRFCYDENIALYEEPKEHQHEKNNNAFDNMAFYDNVALIAGRPIFTIEPIPERNKPIEKQPRTSKTLRWWEDIEKQNRENETKHSEAKLSLPLPISTIDEESESNSEYELTPIPTVNEEVETDSVDTVDVAHVGKAPPIKLDESANVSEDVEPSTSKEKSNKDTLDIDPLPATLRRKSLTQRRMSKSLSLIIDRTELPVIRQSSVPKFYLDTPEANQADSIIAGTPSVALTSPVRPNSLSFHYDLRSVVQMEKEKSQSFKASEKADNRLAHVRRKIIPLKIKRQTSMINLSPSSSTYM